MTARYRVAWTSSAVTGLAVSTVYSDALTQATAEVFGDALQAFVNQTVAEVGGASLSGVVQPIVDLIDPATGAILSQVTVSPPAAGVAGATDVGSKASQALIRFRTSTYVNGRRLQGRMFVPAVKKTAITPNGDLAGAYVTAINTAGATLLAANQGVVWSRTHGSQALWTSVSATSTLAVLRSRRD